VSVGKGYRIMVGEKGILGNPLELGEIVQVLCGDSFE
jgi:hypothetical protein